MAVVERGGKSSHSEFHVVRHVGNYSFVKIRIYTGRTHQIRVHSAHLGTPVLGDQLYARSDSKHPDIQLCLAATKLSFFDKYTNTQLTFKIKPPRFMGQVK
jgi:23S rRNA-/tRNA-specific pseudouridylate synthase